MTILSFSVDTVGQSGVEPKFIYINTDNTVAEVIEPGFLNDLVRQGNPISETNMALVVTRATPNAKSAQVSLFDVSYANGDWSLSANSTPLTLANGEIFVGNAEGIATGVTVSGAATISNTGVITLANGAVALANLAAGIAPAGVVKFMGQHTTVGGSASEAITVTGAVAATDRAFVQLVNDGTNNVSVLSAVVTNNTLTVTFSGDPGNDAIINYQLLRAAS